MPRPEDLRKERLSELLTWVRDHDIYLYDDILRKARSLYPFLTIKTIEDYAKTITQIRGRPHEVSLTRKECIVCGNKEGIDMHHVIPQYWFKKYPDKMFIYEALQDFTIPLCHIHHWMMEIRSEKARMIKDIKKNDFRKVIKILNKKLYPKFGHKLLIHKFKNGNTDMGIYLAEINKKRFVIK